MVLVIMSQIWKGYRDTNRQTDRRTTNNRWSDKLTWIFGSIELKKTVFQPEFINMFSYVNSNYTFTLHKIFLLILLHHFFLFFKTYFKIRYIQTKNYKVSLQKGIFSTNTFYISISTGIYSYDDVFTWSCNHFTNREGRWGSCLIQRFVNLNNYWIIDILRLKFDV